MFLLEFEVRPRPNNPEVKECGGAKVCCWINVDTQEEAESIARKTIIDGKWAIIKMEEVSLVTKDTQSVEGMQYFEQAEIDGEVFVFHTWPIKAPDDIF